MSENPLNYVSIQELIDLGLTEAEILDSYQPSSGGVYHARGAEGMGKTLWIAHFYRWHIDNGIYTPKDAVGNLTMRGKYGEGFTTLKGDDLRQYLWDLTHKPYKNKFVIIDEIDSEFPARSFTDREQTEISLRLWHTAKMNNTICMTSHLGNSTDVIIHLATHYYVYPQKPDFKTNSMEFTIENRLDLEISEWTADDIIKSMLIYNRRELTESTDEENRRERPNSKRKKERTPQQILDDAGIDLDIEAEIEKGLEF